MPVTKTTNGPGVGDAEAQRLEAIRRWEVLDCPTDEFARIATLAGKIFGVSYAVVTVIDAEWVWFRAHHGLAIDGIPRAEGLCDTVVRNGQRLVLPDARLDAASLTNPLVAGEMGLRLYAGAPLQTSDGHTIGTLAVLDPQPREVTATEEEILSGLAELVVREFELRLAARVRAAEDAEETSKQRTKAVNYQAAMTAHGVIGQAMGLVMAQRRCGSRAAFDTLRQISQDRNVKLAELARRLVDGAEAGLVGAGDGGRQPAHQ